ncbi:hypothetical protein KDW_04960 [Dictyobacter vulcani]|uniref:LssY-like C-terminal domain-containing protein n=1 Tax=Dictyobacter vulcani TaxID=2607529 RepID=A0A5J4KC40_9CHLR|nr:LssY C-terminal domain-containing protein [Dictyobacter vulcani]GER86334.1 hypothetical protein KDW_04960 [Dictyobacter vulcani]
MSNKITCVMSIISLSLLLFLALTVALICFYPYTYDFTTSPKITRTQSGAAGDPINLVFVGTQAQIMQSFHQAGWLIPDPITLQTSAKIAADSLAHKPYPTAPVSHLYAFGRVQDLAFEKPSNDVQNREHIRLWKTGTRIGGQLVWIGQASYDSGIELSGTTHLPTHHIAPPVDLERNAVGDDLEKTGLVTEEVDAAFTAPILYARNGGGDYYESDGDVLVITYAHAPIQFMQQEGMIAQLKDGFFLFYDTLETSLLLAVAVGIMGFSLVVVGGAVLRWLFQKFGVAILLSTYSFGKKILRTERYDNDAHSIRSH